MTYVTQLAITVASNSPYELEYSDRQVLQVIVLGELH